jgi:hypothetical protein
MSSSNNQVPLDPNYLEYLTKRSMHELLIEAERAVLPPSRHAGKVMATESVDIVQGEGGILHIVVDGRHALHIALGENCKVAVLSKIVRMGDWR